MRSFRVKRNIFSWLWLRVAVTGPTVTAAGEAAGPGDWHGDGTPSLRRRSESRVRLCYGLSLLPELQVALAVTLGLGLSPTILAVLTPARVGAAVTDSQ